MMWNQVIHSISKDIIFFLGNLQHTIRFLCVLKAQFVRYVPTACYIIVKRTFLFLYATEFKVFWKTNFQFVLKMF